MIDCIVVGTTIVSRKRNLLEALESIDNKAPTNLLSHRLISIDDFGEGVTEQDKEAFKKYKFDYFVEKRRGMVVSLRQALDKVSSEWVLYCEDDLTLRWLPTMEDFTKALAVDFGDRTCGILGLNVGGYSPQHLLEIDKVFNDRTQYTMLSNEWCAMKRHEQYRNNFFIDFPATFMRTDLLKMCIDKCVEDSHGREIEHGITQAWFDLELDKKFFKLSLLKYPWSEDETLHMNWDVYTSTLQTIIYKPKIQILGGHHFGESF